MLVISLFNYLSHINLIHMLVNLCHVRLNKCHDSVNNCLVNNLPKVLIKITNVYLIYQCQIYFLNSLNKNLMIRLTPYCVAC